MLKPHSAFTQQSISEHLSAGHPLTVRRGEHHCCLVCLRQFKSERHLCRHLDRSTLHADNLAAAIAAGRVPPTAASRPDDASRPSAGAKRLVPDTPADACASGASSNSGSMSALEQMELFAKSLKGKATRTEKPIDMGQVDSNHARSMNKQMDWICSGCNMTNFARVVVCIKCKRHVDGDTEYISNRLKEIKHQRFATVFASDEKLSRFAPAPPPQEARPDGSFGDGSNRRGGFHC